MITSAAYWAGRWKTYVVETNSARISDIEIWRAANQVMKLHPVEPELAACQRADAAYVVGDMLNFELWQRVATAIAKLLRTNPDGNAIN